jgi:MFS family permease
MCGAALLLSHQLAGKAARDGLFLSRFTPNDLPKIVALAALVAIILGLLFSRLLSRYGPAKVVPAGLALSAVLHAIEFALLPTSPELIVTLVYLHIVGLGAVLLSGFWSLSSELFDPHEAKRRFGQIAGAGTAGGILGGLAAERTVSLASSEHLLLLLAGLHFTAALVAFALSPSVIPIHEKAPEAGLASARRAFEQAPFLFSLAILVLLGTTSAALVDYLFKSGAAAAFGRGPELTRYFAIFYTGAQVVTFLVQTFVTPAALERLGLGRTVMSLALTLCGGSVGALFIPTYSVVAGLRAGELVLRGSLFRSGYELFFTPIPAANKRAVKTVIDVGCDRLGDALGAAALQLFILLGPIYARTEILLFTAALAACSIWITRRMDRAYVGVLEHGLRNRAIELDINDVEDSTTMSVVMRSIETPAVPAQAPANPSGARAITIPLESGIDLLQRLRSADAEAVRHALKNLTRPEPIIVPQLIRLLAWDEVSDAARQALLRCHEKNIGQLTDVLLDDQQDFAIRRRIPRILARCHSARAVEGLLASLDDPRCEIRFQSSRALDYIHQHRPELAFTEERIYPIVERELSVSKPIWEGRKLLDERDASDPTFHFLDDILRERTNQSLEHVFSLLATVLPREPLKTAFRALHSEDRLLRGLGLEYLSSTLPPNINTKLIDLTGQGATLSPQRDAQAVLDELMASGNSLVFELKSKSRQLNLESS